MKAFLLVAGLGTRLRPLTNNIPKCLMDICGKPLLEWWLEKLESLGVESVLINTYHLAEKIEDFVADYDGEIDIKLFYEEELLGSAGTVRENRDFVGEDDFLIIYGDNLTDVDIRPMIEFHRRKKSPLTMGVMRMPRPETRGIAVLDKDGLIVEFVEKSPNPPGDLANAGIKVASPKLFDYLTGRKIPFDFGFDVFPKMTGVMYGYELSGYLQDIGTPSDLESARRQWAFIIEKEQQKTRG